MSWMHWWGHMSHGRRSTSLGSLLSRANSSCHRKNKTLSQMKIRFCRGVHKCPVGFASLSGLNDRCNSDFQNLLNSENGIKIYIKSQQETIRIFLRLKLQALN